MISPTAAIVIGPLSAVGVGVVCAELALTGSLLTFEGPQPNTNAKLVASAIVRNILRSIIVRFFNTVSIADSRSIAAYI